MKNFAYIRSHRLTDVSSYFVVSDKAYYNLAVQGGTALIILLSTAGGPSPCDKTLSRWERALKPTLLELSLCKS